MNLKEEMAPKERILAALSGKSVDRLPWSPFLAYWWEAQSPEFQAQGQLSFMEEIHADPLLRGFHCLFEKHINGCGISTVTKGNERLTKYETPVGSLFAKNTYVHQGNTWFLTEHPVKTKEDFKTLIWMFENMSLHPSMDSFIRDYNDIGNRGLCMPVVGTEGKTSFQSMVESWVGTEELVYFLEDCPQAVEECLAAMQAKALESVAISVDSPAEAFIFWEDSSTQNISPGLFRKYAAPEIEGYAAIIKPAGKKLAHHACGHIKSLIPLMAGTGIDCIESITPPPTGNIELSEAFYLLPEHIALIGGIGPVFLLNASLCELRGYVEALIKNTNGRRFILANSDSCPPGVAVEKFMLISEIVRGQGNI